MEVNCVFSVRICMDVYVYSQNSHRVWIRICICHFQKTFTKSSLPLYFLRFPLPEHVKSFRNNLYVT